MPYKPSIQMKFLLGTVGMWFLLAGGGFAAGRLTASPSVSGPSVVPVLCGSLVPGVKSGKIDPDSIYENVGDVHFRDLSLNLARCIVFNHPTQHTQLEAVQ